MFGKPSASSFFSGNILRNVETGRVFPYAPVSIFRRNLWMPFRFGNLMLMSTKASSLWVILMQLNVKLSFVHQFLCCCVLHQFSRTVFSCIAVDGEILVFCVLCFVTSAFVLVLFRLTNILMPKWFVLTHVLHFDPNAGQTSRWKVWLLPHLRHLFDIVERIGVLMACILVLSLLLLFPIALSCLMWMLEASYVLSIQTVSPRVRVFSFLSNSFWKSAMGVLVIMSSIIRCSCSCSVNEHFWVIRLHLLTKTLNDFSVSCL